MSIHQLATTRKDVIKLPSCFAWEKQSLLRRGIFTDPRGRDMSRNIAERLIEHLRIHKLKERLCSRQTSISHGVYTLGIEFAVKSRARIYIGQVGLPYSGQLVDFHRQSKHQKGAERADGVDIRSVGKGNYLGIRQPQSSP
jgi:hypothetical protein